MKSLFFTIAIFFSILQPTFSANCPPPPVPLRQLVNQAEIIVVGIIRSTNKSSTDSYSGLKAELEVQQVLQGQVKQRTITLFFNMGMVLPYNEDSLDGNQMIAFLSFNEDKGIFYPVSYASGYKVLDPYGVSSYRQRIKEIQAINSLKDEKRKEQLTINWLIACAEDPITHWEGASELSPFSRFLRYYDEALEEYVQKVVLNEAQKRRIRALLLDLKDFQYVDMGLIDSIAGWQDPEIYQLVANHLKSVDPEYVHNQQYLMARLSKATKRTDLIDTLEKFNTLEYDDDWQEKANAIALEFVNKL